MSQIIYFRYVYFRNVYSDSFKNEKAYCRQIHDLSELFIIINRICVNPYYKGNPSSSREREYLMRGVGERRASLVN